MIRNIYLCVLHSILMGINDPNCRFKISFITFLSQGMLENVKFLNFPWFLKTQTEKEDFLFINYNEQFSFIAMNEWTIYQLLFKLNMIRNN